MKKIVLTGGPCAGKTTVLEEIKKEFQDKVVIVPEMATTLLRGFPVPGKDIHWTLSWQKSFQTAVVAMQREAEKAHSIKAIQAGSRMLICDRGLLDGAAYTLGGLEEFSRRYEIKIEKALSEYEAVIHLESLAVGRQEYYGDTNNSLRFENREEAIKLEHSTRKAWSMHPKHFFISCKNGLEGKIFETKKILKMFLP